MFLGLGWSWLLESRGQSSWNCLTADIKSAVCRATAETILWLLAAVAVRQSKFNARLTKQQPTAAIQLDQNIMTAKNTFLAQLARRQLGWTPAPYASNVSAGNLHIPIRSRIHEHAILLRFLDIILRVIRLEVSIYNVCITNQFQTTFVQVEGSKIRWWLWISKRKTLKTLVF